MPSHLLIKARSQPCVELECRLEWDGSKGAFATVAIQSKTHSRARLAAGLGSWSFGGAYFGGQLGVRMWYLDVCRFCPDGGQTLLPTS